MFNEYQLEEIKLGKTLGLDVSVYSDPSISYISMAEIRKFMALGVDVKPYVNQGFNADQLSKIFYGLYIGLDVSSYAKPELSWVQMHNAMKKLENARLEEKYSD